MIRCQICIILLLQCVNGKILEIHIEYQIYDVDNSFDIMSKGLSLTS